MDKLFQLIDERIAYMAKKMPFISSLPCAVTEVLENNMVRVQVFSDGAIYTVPNWSGSALRVGENAHLFFRGSTFSESTAYVGACINKNSSPVYVNGYGYLGALTSTSRNVAKIGFKNFAQEVYLVFNAVAQIDENNAGGGAFTITIDEAAQTYVPQFSGVQGGYANVSFTIPYTLALGEHDITISGTGSYASLTMINCFVFGDVQSNESPYSPTTDNDYIYRTISGEVGVIYYIGEITNPEIPTELGGNPVKILECTAFNYTDVTAVSIPDGVTTIE